MSTETTKDTGKGLLQLAEEFTDQAARLAAVNRMDDRELADALEAVDFLTGPLPCAGRVCADADAVDAVDLRARERAERFRAALADPGNAEQRALAAGNRRNATGGQDARGGRELLARLGQGDYETEVWG